MVEMIGNKMGRITEVEERVLREEKPSQAGTKALRDKLKEHLDAMKESDDVCCVIHIWLNHVGHFNINRSRDLVKMCLFARFNKSRLKKSNLRFGSSVDEV